MNSIKNTQTLLSEGNTILNKPITTQAELAKFRFHLQDIIKSVLNAQDPNVNVFTNENKATTLNAQRTLNQIETRLIELHYNNYIEDEAVSTEDAGVWTSKALLSIPLLPIGDYAWEWSVEINVSSVNKIVSVKFEDNATIAGEANIDSGDVANWYTVGGFRKITQTVAAPKTLEILFKGSAHSGTASIRRARIILKLL